MNLNWIYTALSWVLLRWHDLWDGIGVGDWLSTSWQWILSIVFLVVTIRIVLFPLFVKQIKSQRAMQALQPQLKELQAKYKGDRETLQREMMELYRREKANPLMGCLPLLLQAPVFIGLLHVLRRLHPWTTHEPTRQLYTWTSEQFKSASEARLFGAPIWANVLQGSDRLNEYDFETTAVRIVGVVLIVTMVVTTFFSTRQMILKTGWNEDPQQRMIQKLMLYGIPGMLLVSGFFFPIGVVLYWVVNNLFSLGQQQWVLHKYPPPKTNGKKAPTAKPGSKEHAKQLAEERERAKALAPKPGAKPTNPKKRPAGKRNPSGNQSKAQKIAAAKEASGASRSKKSDKGQTANGSGNGQAAGRKKQGAVNASGAKKKARVKKGGSGHGTGK